MDLFVKSWSSPEFHFVLEKFGNDVSELAGPAEVDAQVDELVDEPVDERVDEPVDEGGD